VGSTTLLQGCGAFAGCGSLWRKLADSHAIFQTLRAGKHGNLINVIELAVSLAVKRRPQIRNKDLRSLQEAHLLALKCAFVPETRELLGKEVD
jgi:hypothetical protein